VSFEFGDGLASASQSSQRNEAWYRAASAIQKASAPSPVRGRLCRGDLRPAKGQMLPAQVLLSSTLSRVVGDVHLDLQLHRFLIVLGRGSRRKRGVGERGRTLPLTSALPADRPSGLAPAARCVGGAGRKCACHGRAGSGPCPGGMRNSRQSDATASRGQRRPPQAGRWS